MLLIEGDAVSMHGGTSTKVHGQNNVLRAMHILHGA